MIPKIIHYVWVGSPLPHKQRSYIETWRRAHPSYEVVCWNESNIDLQVPVIRDAYRRRKWSMVADIARLIAVHQHGGICLDTDFEVYKPLDELLGQPGMDRSFSLGCCDSMGWQHIPQAASR